MSSINIGRTTLNLPIDIDVDEHDVDGGIAGPFVVQVLRMHGVETTQASADALDKEVKRCKRRGGSYAYCESTDGLFDAGHYRVAGSYQKPGGAPSRRPWKIELARRFFPPLVVRYAYSDNVLGVDTADVQTEEGTKVVWSPPNTTEAVILQHRAVAGAEKLNLRAGTWLVVARVKMVTTFTQKLRAQLTDLPGTLLGGAATGAQVTASTAGVWQDVSLGRLTVPDANSEANCLEVTGQAVGADLNDVQIDHVRIQPG